MAESRGADPQTLTSSRCFQDIATGRCGLPSVHFKKLAEGGRIARHALYEHPIISSDGPGLPEITLRLRERVPTPRGFYAIRFPGGSVCQFRHPSIELVAIADLHGISGTSSGVLVSALAVATYFPGGRNRCCRDLTLSGELLKRFGDKKWYSGWDLNPHVLRQWSLNPPRLPISPPEHIGSGTGGRTRLPSLWGS